MTEAFIFLVGPMGAGKTTIGRHLASVMGMPFVDTDQLVEDRSGADIPWIFDVEGEDGFRLRESKALEDVCAGTEAVVATGGGIVMQAANRELIKSSGFTVYLHASLEQQFERTGRDKSRPLLKNNNAEEILSELMKYREPLYRSLADLVYQTDNRNPRATATEIAESIREHCE